MPEPQIQYATTDDGVSIAYYTMGDGPPIVTTSTIYYSHLLVGRRMRLAIGALLEPRHSVVRYDGRGSGLSQRGSPNFSLAARLLDLEAVVDRLAIERFVLFGPTHGGLAAVAYAVRHPERVTHLILWNAYACGRDFYASSPALRAFTSMREITKDQWESYTLTVASWEVEFADSDRAKEVAAVSRASLEPAELLAFNDASAELDVTDLLPRVRMPTLLLARSSQGFAHLQSSQVLASRIPDARLVVLESSTLGGLSAVGGLGADGLRAIGEFLGNAPPADEAGEAPKAAAAPREETSAFRTILFTDIVGHTEMMQRLGDDAGRAVLREHERITREALKQHGGVVVKTDGDSFMASFTSATKAVECAVALQRAFAQHSEGGGEPIVVRMGLNIGEPIEEEGDFFGSAVILGARIKDLASGSEILVPEAVRHLLSGKNFIFADRGETPLKGFEDPVRLYEVRWRE
ncbi:MAG: adenylate/guanylate cyclase domain-containing protein [Chloroflexota bacterium]|nr:adenylate/guanylate cyclase domain-containing protein [Chloroflexota bacterium]